MKQIYEIRSPLSPLGNPIRNDIFYQEMDLEGLCFTLSHMYRIQYLLLVNQNDLKHTFESFKIENATLEQALYKISSSIPDLKWEVTDQMMIIYNETGVDGGKLKMPMAIQMAYRDLNAAGQTPVTLLDVFCHLAEKFQRSIVCSLDCVDINQYLEIPLKRSARLGAIAASMRDQIPGLSLDCFENVIHIESSRNHHWMH